MQKKEDARDYKKYDYISAAVKCNGADELTAHYAVLGWQCCETRKDKVYCDILHITFCRPHNIVHKDELQLLQVYFEAALNKIGKINANPCPKTLCFGLIFGIISLTAMVLGLCGGLNVIKFIPYVWGYVLFGAGLLAIAVTAVISVKLSVRERREAQLQLTTAGQEIAFVDITAKKLLNNGNSGASDER